MRDHSGATPIGDDKPVAFGAPKSHFTTRAEPVQPALERAAAKLAGLQRDDGHWRFDLEGDTIVESEFILLQAILGRWTDRRVAACAVHLRATQSAQGGWGHYPGGPDDVSVSVKAYFALKIAGEDSEGELMTRARAAILRLGGAESVNSFTRFYLAALGQVPYDHCPSVPVELSVLPTWFPVNLYAMSAWTRAIVVPLSIVGFYRPVTTLPTSLGIEELFLTPPRAGRPPLSAQISGRLFSWANFFRWVDRGLKLYERCVPKAWRRPALRAAERWMIDHFEGSDGVGAIFPPMVYSLVALRCLGYDEESEEFRWAERQLDGLYREDDDRGRVQPCLSPVWDTAWSTLALAEAGRPANDPCLEKAADWLLDHEIREPGDWNVAHPSLEPAGWAFEYRNRYYADLDDTALVVLALRATTRFLHEEGQNAIHRAVCFLEGMQNRDHGWGAFDRNVDNRALEAIPFADHNAMLDPSSADVTARVVEMLGRLGYRRGKPMLDRAIEYLTRTQEPEGCWRGRWGVNYVYGTWQTLAGLRSIGYDMGHPRIRKAVQWLKSVQANDGGWGESCGADEDRSLMGRGGPTTPSQTAWALLGLMAAGEIASDSVARGVRFLLDRQSKDGGWVEEEFTGIGFPKVFYLRYHGYALYFPLLALARYHRWTDDDPAFTRAD